MRKAVNAGSLWLNRHREHVNAINVYPVADGDTGTNMVQTLRSAAIGANEAKSDSLGDVASAIAIYSLRGAQGNSGVILSQYFKGVAEYIGDRKRIYVDDLPGTFAAGAESAYKAVREPREGTILTVLREVAEHTEANKGRRKSLSLMMESAIEHGKKTLASTKFKLKALSDANVVDAGGQGFVHFLEGIYHLINKGEIAKDDSWDELSKETPKVIEEISQFRYCSEFLLRGSDFDTNAIKTYLEPLGDSLIVASTSFGKQSYLRIHIHTDQPEFLEKYAVTLGVLEKRKIEDMKAQNTTMKKWQVRLKKTNVQTVRIVTDSTADLPPELATYYDIEIVPLKIMFGDDVYHDGIDLDKQSFYRKLRESEVLPKTSQPSPGDFFNRYGEVFERGDCTNILSIHIASSLSGTVNSAANAAKKFNGKAVTFDSGSVSLGLGLMVIFAAEMARDGYSLKKIVEKLEVSKKDQKLFFTLANLDYVIKGGRIGKARGFVGKLLGLKPILSFVNGEVLPVAKAMGDDKVMEKILPMLPEKGSNYRWGVAHAERPEKGEELTNLLKDRYKTDNILTGEIGPTIGTHVGPGTWGVFFMKG